MTGELNFGTVAGLGQSDSTVVVSDGVTEREMECLSGYGERREGDRVVFTSTAGGTWLVLGRWQAGAVDPVTSTQLNAAIDRLDDRVQSRILDLPEVQVQTSTAAPAGSGWVSGTVSVRTLDSGRAIQLHVQTTVVAAEQPVNRPKPSNARPPAPVTLLADDALGWRVSGPQTAPAPQAGSWTGPAWRGAWFWGTRIREACAGRTVTRMELRVTRRSSGAGYHSRSLPTHFALHDRTRVGKTSALVHTWDGPRIANGGRATTVIPAGQRERLAEGDMRGIGVFGSGRGDYLLYGSTAELTITYGM